MRNSVGEMVGGLGCNVSLRLWPSAWHLRGGILAVNRLGIVNPTLDNECEELFFLTTGIRVVNYVAALGAKGMCTEAWLVEALSPLIEILHANVSVMRTSGQKSQVFAGERSGIG
ncbi:hypothetical protein K1719_043499 [Acacia pycnantha]|nr:hypothetical protein K1719_043499 [Acacia pycnantha]